MKFEQRPSGARTFLGRAFIKLGPDSLKEAELLNYVGSRIPDSVPDVLASGNDYMVLEPLTEALFTPGYEGIVWCFRSRLLMLHTLDNPSWRLCSFEDYRAYCLYPHSDRVPSWIYDLVKKLKPSPWTPVFTHGDATLANAILCEDGIFRFIDLSVRPTCGDPRQDWSKLFFSSVLGFNIKLLPQADLDSLFYPYFDDRKITDEGFAFHLAANLARVLRKEPLSDDIMQAAHYFLEPYCE